MEFGHYSVLLNECIEALNIKPDGIYVDGTTGMGGHSEKIAEKLCDSGRLICLDRDDYALETASKRLAEYKGRVTLFKSNFADMRHALNALGIEKVDGVLLDLGVSSPQLDDPERGFSYMNDAPLDMRMDRSSSLDAGIIVNCYSYEQLKHILYDYGEEKFAPKIAAAIVKRREIKKIETTVELSDIIRSAMPASALREKQHPAKRSFQAIRIAVNEELMAVEEIMNSLPDILKIGGRAAIISFHSLEDRIVKTGILVHENGCTCPRDFPVCVCGFKQTLKCIGKKPILPSEKELSENPRSRSAKLRICERV